MQAIKALWAYLFIMAFVLPQSPASAQSRAFDKRIRSLECKIAGTNSIRLTPYYLLNSEESLQVKFDILGEELQTLGYRLQHCDADWKPSGLQSVEYLDGFADNEMHYGEESRATLVPYAQYSLQIPHETCRPKLSGNYLLSVYDVYNPDELLLQVGFRVVQNLAKVEARVSPITYLDSYARHQQVDLKLDLKNLQLMRPIDELRPVILQNGREDNRQTLSKPSSIVQDKIFYEQHQGAVFEAGNTYRKVEMLSDTYNGMGVSKSYRKDGRIVVELYADKNRVALPYVYDEDMHGLQVIRTVDAARGPNEIEYYDYAFSFYSDPLPGQVILSGMAFDYLPLSERVLYYDAEEQCYWRNLELKQGYFNYLYLLKGDKARLSTESTEGNHYETKNAYTCFLYQYDMARNYQAIVGVAELR